MAEKKKYNSILVSGRKDETLTYSRYVKDEESGESVKESLDKKVNITDELTTQQIKNGAITNEKMADNSVGNSNLKDGSVSNEKLEDGSITNEKLAENSITKDKLKDNTIGVEKLDPELRQTINAATGLPENLVETIQNVDDTLADHQSQLNDKQSQIDDKQQQITANDEDISLLHTRSTQMEETIKSIAATGGASQATAVTYDNANSQLTATNIQSAVDELQGSKFDKTSILQEFGEANDKVMSQKAVSAKLSDLSNFYDKDNIELYRNTTPIATSQIVDGYYIKYNLVPVVQDNWHYAYYPVEEGKTYLIKGTVSGWYAASICTASDIGTFTKAIVTTQQNNSIRVEMALTIETGIKYVVFSYYGSSNVFLFEKDNTSTESRLDKHDSEIFKKADKSYVDTELGKKFDKESVVQESGEAEDKVMSQKAITDSIKSAKKKTGTIIEDGFIKNDGTIQQTNEYYHTKIHVKGINRMTFYNSIDKNSTLPALVIFGQNNELLKSVSLWDNAEKYVTINIPDDAEYIIVSIRNFYSFEYYLYNDIITQELGNSENTVVSQKVFTDKINTLERRIGVYSKNGYVKLDGTIVESNNYNYVKLQVAGVNRITFYNNISQNETVPAICFFDKEDKVIDSKSLWTIHNRYVTLPISANTEYIKISLNNISLFEYYLYNDVKEYIDNNAIIDGITKFTTKNSIAILSYNSSIAVNSDNVFESRSVDLVILSYKLYANTHYKIKCKPKSGYNSVIGKVTSVDNIVVGNSCEIISRNETEIDYTPETDEIVIIANTTGYANAYIYEVEDVYSTINTINNNIYYLEENPNVQIVNGSIISKLFLFERASASKLKIYNFKEGDIAYIHSNKTTANFGDFIVADSYDETNNVAVNPLIKGYYGTYDDYFIYKFKKDGCVIVSTYINKVEVYKCKRNNDEINLLKEQIKSISSESALASKTLSCYGDSIAYGLGNNGLGFAGIIANMFNMEFDQQAVSGATIRSMSGRTSIPNQIASHFIKDSINADYIIVEGGVNDLYFWKEGDIPEDGVIGTLPTSLEAENYTINAYSNLKNSIYERLDWELGHIVHNSKSTAKIMYVIIHKHGAANYPANENWKAVHKAILDCCEKWGIPVCDLWESSIMNTTIDKYKTYTNNSDGVHPTDMGYRLFYVPQVLKMLQSL